MDFNLKQWRNESEEEEQETSAEAAPCAKLQRLNPNPHYSSSPALPLFEPQPTTATAAAASATKLPRMGSYFSLAQWQELELQALIFRHIIAGAAVPPELLHLVNKSRIPSPPYYLCNPLHYYHHPSLVQTGYWSKAAMDPEPGRCRRTDGKKWRCSRDVVAGQKYCERHMHRGKNRSRKPVEIPTSAAAYGGIGGAEPNIPLNRGMSAAVGGGAAPRFTISGPSTSMDLLHHNHNRRPSLDSMAETKCPFEAQNDSQNDGDPTLRHFFDDWPRSLHEANNAAHSAASTNLSISTSDFSLKLGSGNGDESRGQGSRPQMNWGMSWEAAHPGAAAHPSMGGPLAEALRSSMSTSSSPTSVLHRLQRCSASDNTFVCS